MKLSKDRQEMLVRVHIEMWKRIEENVTEIDGLKWMQLILEIVTKETPEEELI